jgi:predicted RNase H-like nuclease (RuvC/YqgF family)
MRPITLEKSGGAMRKHMSAVLIAVFLCVVLGYGQSVADTARQERQKEVAKDSATAPKVITNDDLTETTPNQTTPRTKTPSNKVSKADWETAAFERNAEKAKAAILAQETRIKSLQTQIDKMRASIRYVETEVPLNQVQLQKQQTADHMQEQLNLEVKHLEAMQEAARRAGFGSVVYNP